VILGASMTYREHHQPGVGRRFYLTSTARSAAGIFLERLIYLDLA
jgi:hypothetical protein